MPLDRQPITRVQTGVRIEKRVLKVLKIIAAHHEIGLGDLLEGICLYVFEAKQPFDEKTLEIIDDARARAKLDLTAADSHLLQET
ncbi:MAG: hypothetical protein ACX939_06365 [Hyphococcus sp.]